MISFLYLIGAVGAIGFLIFIHELGHYYTAKKTGMKVEIFSIGFGKTIYSWQKGEEVWKICMLPFGGYVKIAGMEGSDSKTEPEDIPGGFFSKGPIARIMVLFMGPFVNLAFAFIAFTLIWSFGGREKDFSEYNATIGWVDTNSTLYEKGVRPGDEIISYNDHAFGGRKDHISAPLLAGDSLEIKGAKVDWKKGTKDPFEFVLKTYQHPKVLDKDISTVGILNSARYLIYNTFSDGVENPLSENSPMLSSGLQYKDRIYWVDGEVIFSIEQLSRLLNDGRSLLTVEREGKRLLVRVPRVVLNELKFPLEIREEIKDWQYEAGLNKKKTQDLFYIPYNITTSCIVEERVGFIDEELTKVYFPDHLMSKREQALLPGDKIVAVDGFLINKSFDLLSRLQSKFVHIVVDRDETNLTTIAENNADSDFFELDKLEGLQIIVESIGSKYLVNSSGSLHLLNPVTPKTQMEIVSEEDRVTLANLIKEAKKEIEFRFDANNKKKKLEELEAQQSKLLLGVPALQDRRVVYNPDPFTMFVSVLKEIRLTLYSLFSGSLSPEWLAGPITIVRVIHHNWSIGLKEVLFWVGAISLNLGMLNLMPIPMLDGGYICFTLFELITRKKLPPKTIEKFIIPFAVFFLVFFLYVSFNDMFRLFDDFNLFRYFKDFVG